MLTFPQGDLFIAQYCSEPVTSFPTSPVMLACPQVDLFTAQYYAEPVTYFPSSLVMLACPQGDCFIVKYGRDVHSYIVGTERKGNKKERKKNIEPAAKKKIQHSGGSGGLGIYVQINNLFWLAG